MLCFFTDLPQTWHILAFSKTFLNRSCQQKIIPHTNVAKPSFLQIRRHIQRFLKFWNNWQGLFFRWFTLNLAYFDIFKKFLNRSYQRKRIPHTNFTKPCFLQTRRHIQRFLKFWENWHGSFFRRFTPNLAYFDIFENFSIDPISNKKFRIQILQNHVFLQTKRHIQRFPKFWKNRHSYFFSRIYPKLGYLSFSKIFLNRSYQQKKIPLTNFMKPCFFLQTRRYIWRFLIFWKNWQG